MLFTPPHPTPHPTTTTPTHPLFCRSHQYYVQLFEQAGMRMTHTALQKDFPKGLFKGGSLPRDAFNLLACAEASARASVSPIDLCACVPRRPVRACSIKGGGGGGGGLLLQ